MGEKSDMAIGGIFMILFLLFGIIQIGAGWAGIEDSFGWGWGIAAAVAAIMFRFTLPIVFGAYLCATNIWDWHWAAAALFAAPGLLFMVPALTAGLLSAFKK